jgi:hypothetical protein
MRYTTERYSRHACSAASRTLGSVSAGYSDWTKRECGSGIHRRYRQQAGRDRVEFVPGGQMVPQPQFHSIECHSRVHSCLSGGFQCYQDISSRL